jgi:hypothetical protein
MKYIHSEQGEGFKSRIIYEDGFGDGKKKKLYAQNVCSGFLVVFVF